MNLKTTLLLLATLTSSISHAASTNTPTTPAAASNEQSTNQAPPVTEVLNFINAWARPATGMAGKINNSAMYVTINNDTDASYNLINVSSDVANKVELHQTFTDEQGVSKMVKIDKLLIPAKTTVELKPGSTHIMLYDLKRSLNAGDKFNISLFFDSAPVATIKVTVSNNAPTQ